MKGKSNDSQLNLFHQVPAQERADKGQSIVAKGSNDTRRKSRSLKVQYGEYNGSRRRHPVLRLAGFWLKGFGLAIGDTVEITGGDGVLNIRKVKKAGG